MEESLILLTSVIAIGIAAQWLAWRLRLPSILLLLAFGFLAGQLGLPMDKPLGDDPSQLLFPAVSLGVAIILFEGGMSLQFHELREAGRVVTRMVTIGVIITWCVTAFGCWYFIGMAPAVAALTGAILVVTGPTVIAPLLRHIAPARRIGSIVKWEGIVIDPIGAVLAVLVFEVVINHPDSLDISAPSQLVSICVILLKTSLIGTVLGLFAGLTVVQLLKRYLIPDFLHSVSILAVVVTAFTLSNQMQHECGLVTVTVLGVFLANQTMVPVRHIVEFKENLRVLLISCMFIVLSSRIGLDEIVGLGVGGICYIVLLIVVVRPLSVLVATWGTDLSWRERTFLAFLAPRGIVAAAVSSVFAAHLQHQNVPGAETIVPLTFLVIVGTVTFYGLASAPLARKLGLSVVNPQGLLIAGATGWIREIALAVQKEGYRCLLIDTNYENVAAARMDGLTAHCASILSGYVEEEIDLSGIGRLLALTPNDDLNGLAAMEYSSVFGRASVFQLTPSDSGRGRRETSHHVRGRSLFSEESTHSYLEYRFSTGAQVKCTKLTEEFTYAKFQEFYGDDVIPLFLKSADGQLDVCTTDQPTEPAPGTTIIAIVDAGDHEANEKINGDSSSGSNSARS